MLARFAVVMVIAVTSPAFAQVCGDVDDDGRLTASDALRVLKGAVNLPSELVCDTGDCIALEARVDALESATLLAVDGNGHMLGRVLQRGGGGGTQTLIVVPGTGGLTLEIVWIREDFDETSNISLGLNESPPMSPYPVLYESEDCSGEAYGLFAHGRADANKVIVMGGRTYRALAVKAKPHNIRSELLRDGSCIPSETNFDPLDSSSWAMFLLEQIELPFDLPAPGPLVILPIR